MVAKITEPKNIHKAIYYNENKVGEGVAKFLAAGNFLKDGSRLTMGDKFQRFDRLMELNHSRTHALHITLSFPPGEVIEEDAKLQIAREYMELIGFGNHPYLVYEHFDTGHPHIHIVTSSLREDGTRKDFHNIGEEASEKARKFIEEKYKLVRAEEQKTKAKAIDPLDVQKLQYSKSETKRGITNVLDAVLNIYRYTSLAELNTVLSLYNVRAHRGEPGSRLHDNRGLVYQLIKEDGTPVGKAVKASSIYSAPTLKNLEKFFEANSLKPMAGFRRIKSAIDFLMLTPPSTLQEFIDELKKDQIYAVAWLNKEGRIYGVSFVDTKNKSVYKGSQIGKAYTAKGILEKIFPEGPRQSQDENKNVPAGNKKERGLEAARPDYHAVPRIFDVRSYQQEEELLHKITMLEILLATEPQGSLPYELRVDKKKKKYKPQN